MIDQRDKIILEMLEENARTPFTTIAKKLKITEGAIRKRVKKLEDKGIIISYQANVNYKKIGFSNKVVMGIDTTPDKYLSIINHFKTLDFVRKLNTSSGDHMIMFDLWIKDMDDLDEKVKIITSIDGVTRVCPAIVHEEILKSCVEKN